MEISFSFWFFAVVLAFVLLDREILMKYIALPVILHETGHLVVMALFGVSIQSIRFTPFSVNIQKESTVFLGYGREILISLGGVLANLLAALYLYLFRFQSMRVMFLIAVNVAVALFNLLPIGSLDGGQVLRLVCERFGGLELAAKASKFFSFLALVPLFAAAIFLFLRGTPNITLMIACLYLAGVVVFRD